MKSISTELAALEASFSGETEHFLLPGPPSDLDFEAWLAERTPPGAPTVALMTPGARFPLRLPRIRPAVPSPTPRFGRRRRGSAPSVHAAYLVDVEGMTPRQLAVSAFFAFTTERAARQHVRDGRLTAADLGMWPWAVVDGKSLPCNWWADSHFALALREWAAAQLRFPLTVSRSPQSVRPRRYTATARLPVA